MKSFGIIGCGRFGSAVAKTLSELGHEVLVIDRNPERIKDISYYVTHALEADVMDESVLKEIGLSNLDVIVVSIGSDLEASIMATLISKESGVERVVVKAQSSLHGKVLEKIGADRIIYPERDMGVRVAHNLTSTNILDYIELSPDFSILEIAALNKWIGKTLSGLRLRNKYGVNVIAIKNSKGVNISPGPDYIIQGEDITVIIGSAVAIKKIEMSAND